MSVLFLLIAIYAFGASAVFGLLLNGSQASATQKASGWLPVAMMLSAAAAVTFGFAAFIAAIIGAFQ